MYYIYFMRDGKKCRIDNGKYYQTKKEAAKRILSLNVYYRYRCMIEFVPAS